MKTKTFNKDYQTYFVLILFFSHQFYYVLKGGTTWDDLEIQKTTLRILDKAFWFFEDRTNTFLGDLILILNIMAILYHSLYILFQIF